MGSIRDPYAENVAFPSPCAQRLALFTPDRRPVGVNALFALRRDTRPVPPDRPAAVIRNRRRARPQPAVPSPLPRRSRAPRPRRPPSGAAPAAPARGRDPPTPPPHTPCAPRAGQPRILKIPPNGISRCQAAASPAANSAARITPAWVTASVASPPPAVRDRAAGAGREHRDALAAVRARVHEDRPPRRRARRAASRPRPAPPSAPKSISRQRSSSATGSAEPVRRGRRPAAGSGRAGSRRSASAGPIRAGERRRPRPRSSAASATSAQPVAEPRDRSGPGVAHQGQSHASTPR